MYSIYIFNFCLCYTLFLGRDYKNIIKRRHSKFFKWSGNIYSESSICINLHNRSNSFKHLLIRRINQKINIRYLKHGIITKIKMYSFKNLRIIGSSHIARQSINEVKKTVEELKPGIIALELDSQRFYAILQKHKPKIKLKDIMKIGIKGFIFTLIAQKIQNKLGKTVGIEPGSEMKEAIKLAKKHNIRIALIDQPINITLKRFNDTLSWKEKFQFVKDLIKGIFFRKQALKEAGVDNFDLTKVPEDKIIKKMISSIKKKYPNIYQALIVERNKVMANHLYKLMNQFKDDIIIAIVGAGHVEGILKELEEKFRKEVSFNVTGINNISINYQGHI